MMEHTCVENTTTLLKTPPPILSQPLEPDAVAPSAIANGNGFSNDEIIVLLALLDGLLGEVMSPDVAYMAMSHALDVCRDAGVPDATFKRAMQKIKAVWKEKARGNPISLLFR